MRRRLVRRALRGKAKKATKKPATKAAKKTKPKAKTSRRRTENETYPAAPAGAGATFYADPYRALTQKYRARRSFDGGTRVEGAARAAAGKAQSVASASASRSFPVPTLSTEVRNALKINQRYIAAQQGVHYKHAIMPDFMHSMHRVRQRAAMKFGSIPNELAQSNYILRMSRSRALQRKRRR